MGNVFRHQQQPLLFQQYLLLFRRPHRVEAARRRYQGQRQTASPVITRQAFLIRLDRLFGRSSTHPALRAVQRDRTYPTTSLEN